MNQQPREPEQTMDEQPQEPEQVLSLPGRISEGMEVCDREDETVGRVQLVYYGGASDAAVERALRPTGAVLTDEEASAPEPDWGTFGTDDVPPELRARMLRQGYIRIEGPDITGLKRYVMPEQIAEVVGNRVQLHATRDELLAPASNA